MLALLLTIISFQLLVTIVVSVKILRWRSKDSKGRPPVSIIIAAKNEEENLKKLIPALIRQQYPDFEIIISLDQCNDGSIEFLEIVNSPSIRWRDIQSIPTNWNSKKYVLNEAIKFARGNWLVFTDADCQPNSDLWLQSIAKEINEKTEVVIGVSPYTNSNKRGLLSSFIQFEAFMTYFLYIGMALLRRPYMAVGRNMAIKKSYFQSLGGYDSIKSVKGGDDDLFIQKADKSKITVTLGSDSLVHTYPSKSWQSYKHQKIRHFSVSSHYKRSDNFFLSIYYISQLGLYLLIPLSWKGNFLLPLILFYLFIKFVGYRFVAGKIGAGFNYILFPVVDVLYAFLIPVLGVWSKLVKDIKWKN